MTIDLDLTLVDQSIRRCGRVVEAENGGWVFEREGVQLLAIVDRSREMLRVMALVSGAERLPADELYALLEANFDQAAEAKYAISHGRVWAVFLHQVPELSDSLLERAIGQVVRLAQRYRPVAGSGNPSRF